MVQDQKQKSFEEIMQRTASDSSEASQTATTDDDELKSGIDSLSQHSAASKAKV